MPKEIRELKAILLKAGFGYTPGKSSHSKWQHSLLNRPIIIARKDGDTDRTTYEEAAKKGQELIESLFIWYQEEGKEMPQPKTLQTV